MCVGKGCTTLWDVGAGVSSAPARCSYEAVTGTSRCQDSVTYDVSQPIDL